MQIDWTNLKSGGPVKTRQFDLIFVILSDQYKLKPRFITSPHLLGYNTH
jgi:hypothetical protein